MGLDSIPLGFEFKSVVMVWLLPAAVVANSGGVFPEGDDDNGLLRLLHSCIMVMVPTFWDGLLGLHNKFCSCVFSFYVLFQATKSVGIFKDTPST